MVPRDLLEPDAGKLARPVLRGPWRSNAPGLPDSLSGRLGGTYTLLAHRHRTGLHLTCRDRGGLCERDAPLAPEPDALDLAAESGRGLALLDALSTDWGDNGNAHYSSVWFYLAFDLAGSQWNG
ncbi:ATP-binding protein [Nocardiopsis sp. LOL_012]|uniref:ATP-binding protein n=1 Tax=Nocardiopsis sp. LOL_012 TaxID=3345409 RepID=UPI003A89EBFC